MKYNIIAAVIVAVGLIAAAFVIRDRYTIAWNRGQIVRIDRWTGTITACSTVDIYNGNPVQGSWYQCQILGKQNATSPVVENLSAENLVVENSTTTDMNSAVSSPANGVAKAAHHPNDLDNLMTAANNNRQ